jgi:low temperature requirement protein LtrA
VIQVGWIAASAPLWIGAPRSALTLARLVGRPRSSISPVLGSHTRAWSRCTDASRSMRPHGRTGRQFLIIALGETVLTTGTAISHAPRDAMTVFTGGCAFVTAVALWALYFAGSDQLVNRHLETTTDPIYAARLVMNGGVVVVGGLIALAVGNELVIAHPHGDTSLELALLLFGGPSLYLLAQTATMCALTRRLSYARVGGLAALVVAGAVSLLVAPFVSIALAAAVLTALVVAVVRTNPAS